MTSQAKDAQRVARGVAWSFGAWAVVVLKATTVSIVSMA